MEGRSIRKRRRQRQRHTKVQVKAAGWGLIALGLGIILVRIISTYGGRIAGPLRRHLMSGTDAEQAELGMRASAFSAACILIGVFILIS